MAHEDLRNQLTLQNAAQSPRGLKKYENNSTLEAINVAGRFMEFPSICGSRKKEIEK